MNLPNLETSSQKVEWKNISSEDDLQNLKTVFGSFQAIKQKLSDDLKMKVPARSYSELYKFIQKCQIIFGELNQENSNTITPEIILPDQFIHKDSMFFVSEQHRLTYALIRLDGSQRMDMLGFTDELWTDVEKIKKWFRNLSKYVHPDYNKIPEASLAWQNLEKLKNDLLKHAEKFGKKHK